MFYFDISDTFSLNFGTDTNRTDEFTKAKGKILDNLLLEHTNCHEWESMGDGVNGNPTRCLHFCTEGIFFFNFNILKIYII